MRLPPDAVSRAGRGQGGVVTRAQLLAIGADDAWLARRVAGGHWQRLQAGVYVPWSGPVPWSARAWAAVLGAGEGAALSGLSAAYLTGMTSREPTLLDITLPHHRRAGYAPGVRVHRRVHVPPSEGRPRRVWRADTAVELVAGSRTVDDAVGWVTAAARAGTHAQELADAISRRGSFRNRALMLDLLTDVAEGVESPLERRYHHDVERRHGLPRARLQRTEVAGGTWIRADCVYEGFGVRVELDGRLGHPGGRTDADTWRDNAVLLEHDDRTLRYRWRHVAVTPCTTAAQVAAALTRGGWSGAARLCGPTCAATR